MTSVRLADGFVESERATGLTHLLRQLESWVLTAASRSRATFAALLRWHRIQRTSGSWLVRSVTG